LRGKPDTLKKTLIARKRDGYKCMCITITQETYVQPMNRLILQENNPWAQAAGA